MPDVLLTLYCAGADGSLICDALRKATSHPVHMREETVFGRDFSDASTAERVTGRLDRRAIEVIVPQAGVEALIDQIESLKRMAPVRWHISPLLAAGRLP
jgi:hypothetical protein